MTFPCGQRAAEVSKDGTVQGAGFFRAADRTLWAHEHDGLLLSARSGAPLAHRVGNIFYDLESDRPLYIEDTHAQLASPGTADGIVE